MIDDNKEETNAINEDVGKTGKTRNYDTLDRIFSSILSQKPKVPELPPELLNDKELLKDEDFVRELPFFAKNMSRALTREDKERVQQLLKRLNIDVDEKISPEGFTLLHSAAAQGHKNMVKILLLGDAAINAMTKDRVTPLFVAVKSGHIDVAEQLLEARAEVNGLNRFGSNLLMAIAAENEDMIQLLLAKGANPNLGVRNANGFQIFPSHLAIQKQRPDILKMLLDARADVDQRTNYHDLTLLHTALPSQNEDIVKMLLDYGANIYATGNDNLTPLEFAISQNYTGVVKLLEEAQKANANKPLDDNTREMLKEAHDQALKIGNKKIIAVIDSLSSGSVSSARKFVSPVVGCWEEGDLTDIGKLAKRFIEMSNYLVVINKLISTGANVNIKDKEGKTLLDRMEDPFLIAILGEVGALPGTKATETIKTLPSGKGYVSMINRLIKSGADLSMKDSEGKTILDHAKGRTIIKILTDAGAVHGAQESPTTASGTHKDLGDTSDTSRSSKARDSKKGGKS